ncbi:MAG: 23S rRNA (uracil(1939)-C(5))-methyltransferase RlmD [Acholeplasma sp.]|nr:23S rRNA (uracil(1939)-C(5))-methyltransferase RlmD [Acholeplasma sp.]
MQKIKVDKVTPEGYVLVKLDKTYIVPNLMENEEAFIEVTKKGIRIDKRLSSHKDRVKAKCPIYDICGGCQLQHLSYDNQMKLKFDQVNHYLTKESVKTELLPVIKSNLPYHYRNKIQMVFGLNKGKIVAGFYEENTHKIVNAAGCDIQDEVANEIINTIKLLMRKHKLMPYNEDTKEGIIRHVMIKRSRKTNQVLVIIVTPSNVFPGRGNLVKDLLKTHPFITSVVHNVNPKETSYILGDQERILFGKGFIEDILLDKRFLISSKTFYQINSEQTEVLYQQVIDFLEPKKTDIILDAYSGIGTIGIILSKYVKKVLAVEINPESVNNAKKNANLNKVTNFETIAMDAKAYIEHLVNDNKALDAIVVDPPRAGLDKAFIDSILLIKPQKVVYVSCNPETLARDLRQLSYTYHIVKVQPVDMFSQTYHVENIVLLSLKTS